LHIISASFSHFWALVCCVLVLFVCFFVCS